MGPELLQLPAVKLKPQDLLLEWLPPTCRDTFLAPYVTARVQEVRPRYQRQHALTSLLLGRPVVLLILEPLEDAPYSFGPLTKHYPRQELLWVLRGADGIPLSWLESWLQEQRQPQTESRNEWKS